MCFDLCVRDHIFEQHKFSKVVDKRRCVAVFTMGEMTNILEYSTKGYFAFIDYLSAVRTLLNFAIFGTCYLAPLASSMAQNLPLQSNLGSLTVYHVRSAYSVVTVRFPWVSPMQPVTHVSPSHKSAGNGTALILLYTIKPPPFGSAVCYSRH